MRPISYIYSRLLKKLRGSAVCNGEVHVDSKIESGSTFVNSSMARHSYCGYDCFIVNADIGSFTSISDNVVIGGARHPMEFVSMSPVFLSHKDSIKTKFARHEYYNIPKVRIGSDVWIGNGAFVKSGVTIGHGAVVGMASVVTKDVPPYAIIAGNPAKVIRYRFEMELIDELLHLMWWEFSDELLSKLGDSITDPKKFVVEAKHLIENKGK